MSPSTISRRIVCECGEELLVTFIVFDAVHHEAWPSELRNLVNYRPGVGYGAVRGSMPCAVFGIVEVDPAGTVADIASRFENNVAGLRSGSVSDQITLATKALVDLAFTLDLILGRVIKEVSDGRGVDRRWMAARARFIRSHAKWYKTPQWPFSDSRAA